MPRSKEEEEAVAQTKLNDLRKKINAESWSDNMELLMKQWGEKAAGLRFMHAVSGGDWKAFSDKLTIITILITTIASCLNLISNNIKNDYSQSIIIYICSFITILSTFLQSFKRFY